MPTATDLIDPVTSQAARTMMVDSQVRPNKVTDPRIIAAMRALPREAFLPATLRDRAYADADVRLPRGRVLPAPMVTARLLQLAQIRSGERCLVIAAGTGYAAAVLSACAAVVTALEEDAELLAMAGPALAAWAPAVSLAAGPLSQGWAAKAPYDLVLIEGAVETLPPAITAQLAPDGRLVMVRAEPGSVGRAVIGRMAAERISTVAEFDCAVTPLPALRSLPAFAF